MKSPHPESLLIWPPLFSGHLIQRYKRFLADIRLEDGQVITAHCPNSGSMQTCADPGRMVYLSTSENPKRKLAHTWELIAMPESLVGVNTLVPNSLVAKAVQAGCLPELAGYDTVAREVLVEKGARLDLCLKKEGRRPCLVEIKNCTRVTRRQASFPDAVTLRGRKHLQVLAKSLDQGFRAALFILVQRMDADFFAPADRIDPEYGRLLRQVVAQGVELICYDTQISLAGIGMGRRLPVIL